MPKLLLLWLCLILGSYNAQAQTTFERLPHDAIWLLNGSYLDFNGNEVTVYPYESEAELELTNTSIANENGELIFYSNNIHIFDASHQIMENGYQINYNAHWEGLVNNSGINAYPSTQHNIALPLEPDDLTILLCLESERYYLPGDDIIQVESLRANTILTDDNNEQSNVIAKDQILIQDTLSNLLTATRHANGRDWWVLLAEQNSNQFYRLLVTPDSIYRDFPQQTIGTATPSGIGQAKFSPDGTTYARLNTVSLGEDQYIDIYQFDRCSGLLSDPIQFVYSDWAFMGGIAFSENSRFLYVPSFAYLYQYDLHSDDIPASRKIIKEATEEESWAYSLAQLAPDGKIYMATQGVKDSLHVIHRPNLPFPACEFEYLGFPLTAPSMRTLPNFPYYGLGPLDGSSCDTLGIDNPVPTAAFEYWQEEPASTAVAFFDASLFAYSWSWDFGDGSAGSSLRHPTHNYAQPGAYEVCLTATNMTGSHTQCEAVMIGTVSSTEVMEEEVGLKAYPNPSSGQLTIELPAGLKGQLQLQDVTGKVWLSASIPGGQSTMEWNTGTLPNGLYTLLYFGEEQELLASQRIVILK